MEIDMENKNKENFSELLSFKLDAIIEHAYISTNYVFKTEALYSDCTKRAYRYDDDDKVFYYLSSSELYVTEYVNKVNAYYKHEGQNCFCYIAKNRDRHGK